MQGSKSDRQKKSEGFPIFNKSYFEGSVKILETPILNFSTFGIDSDINVRGSFLRGNYPYKGI